MDHLYTAVIENAHGSIQRFFDTDAFSQSSGLVSVTKRKPDLVWKAALFDFNKSMEKEKAHLAIRTDPIKELEQSLIELNDFVQSSLLSPRGFEISIAYHPELKQLYMNLGRNKAKVLDNPDKDRIFRSLLEPHIETHYKKTFEMLREAFDDDSFEFTNKELALFLLEKIFTI